MVWHYCPIAHGVIMKKWMVSRFGREIRVEEVPCQWSTEEEALAYLIDQEGYSDDITIAEVTDDKLLDS